MPLMSLSSAIGSLQIAIRRRLGLLPRGKAAEAFESSALPAGSSVDETSVISRYVYSMTCGFQDAAYQQINEACRLRSAR